MRTTVTLDHDVRAMLETAMRERGISFKDALNNAIRAGLAGTQGRSPRNYSQKTYRMGFRPEVNLDKSLSLAAALEDEEISRKLSQRK